MAISKIILNSTSQIDLTSDTVTADKLLQGYTAHDASGTAITGVVTNTESLGILTVENDYLILNDTAEIGYVYTLSNNDLNTALGPGYYQVPEGYFINFTYLIPSTPQLIANWDLTDSLVDIVDEATITVSGATQSSSGLTFTSSSDYATIPFKYRPYHTYELDISSMSMGSLNTHGRLLMMTTNEGLIYRNSSNWNTYLNGSWGTAGSSDSTALAGHTLAMVVENDAPKFYLDGTLWYTSDRVQSLNGNSNIMIGSSGGQSYFNMNITGVRVYEGVKYR